MKKIILFFLILCFFKNSYSQSRVINRIPCEEIHIPVCFHNIAYKFNSFYDYTFDIFDARQIFKKLEKDCIYLDVCEMDSIRDYNFYNLSDEDKTTELIELANMYHKPNCINIYLNGTKDESTFNGISRNNMDTSYIMLSPSSFKNLLNLEQLLYNFFGLRGTSDLVEKEFVNRSNSDVTADRLWDTPADPYYLLGSNYSILPLNSNRKYLFVTQLDPNGDTYNVMYDNIMSQFYRSIQSLNNDLTRNQWQAMAYNEIRSRAIRWKVEK